MFFARTEPLCLSQASLKGLRLSLNTPVVSTEELAVGPARAAIASHDEADGRPNVTIGMRSVKTGSVVLYSFEGDLREQTSLGVVMDAALSFAESMGFLFDEDELEGGAAGAPARAVALWDELMGEDASQAPLGPAPGAVRDEELLLEELVAEDRDDEIPDVLPPDDTDGLVFDGGLEYPADSDAVLPSVPPGYIPQFEGDLGLDSPVEFEGGLDAAEFDSEPAYLAGEAPPIGDLDIAGPLPEPPAEAPPAEDVAAAPLPEPEEVAAAPLPEPEEVAAAPLPEPEEAAAAPLPEAEEAGASPRLTKFRRPDDAEAGQPAEPGRPAALGRVRLVRRGRGPDSAERPEPILRLFGAF